MKFFLFFKPKIFLCVLQKPAWSGSRQGQKERANKNVIRIEGHLLNVVKCAKKILPQINREDNSVLLLYRAYRPLPLTLREKLACSVHGGIWYSAEPHCLFCWTSCTKKRQCFVTLLELICILVSTNAVKNIRITSWLSKVSIPHATSIQKYNCILLITLQI